MRIALITPGFSASEDDWCIPTLLDHVRLLARAHDVHVFALRYPHRRASYGVAGATVHPLGGAETAGLGRLPLLWRALGRIRTEAARLPFAVYHGCWADEPGLLAVLAGRLARRPALVSLMGGELVAFPELGYGGALSRANRLLMRFALRRADAVTAGSRYLLDLAARHAPADRLRAHPWGVDTALFSPWPAADDPALPADRFNLLQVAALSPVKDHLTALRALRLAGELLAGDGEPALHLHLIGDGPLRHELKRTCAELGLTEHVTFHGAVAHERLPGFYRAADLCLLTSCHEAQALVTLEAAACGRATAGTAVGILPELAPALSGPVAAAEALAATIARLARNPGALAAAHQAGEERTRRELTLAQSAAALEQLYAGGVTSKAGEIH